MKFEKKKKSKREKYFFIGKKAMKNLDSVLNCKDITLSTKVRIVKADFSMSYLQMWELDYKESWVLKHWCFQIVVLEKIPESPLDTKAIKPVNPKGN